ncbi:MAG: GGDEF domain-containing phosphodiesterase, partial [Sphaerochaeta sp.]|nr:GGDEF domain-containing phosphodiesterase [Sphaerochaeta sp.]
DGRDAHTLIMNADIAMYSAKSKGKNQVVYCNEEMKAQTTKRLRLTNGLYRALDRNELFVMYQPQMCTETRKVCGFEALVRWNNPEYGLVQPLSFIPLAEQTGLIRPIGMFVFEQACRQLIAFQQTCQERLTMSVNLSVVQLKDARIVENMKKILKKTGVDVHALQIEITESATFLDEPILLERIFELKQLGLSLAFDDFGTGHSSFSRLKTYPIDQLKIDIEFVQGITTGSDKDKALIKSIIQTAKNLGMEVLAEGVETEEQLQFLSLHGCDKVQGFYFSKPLKVEEISCESLLTTH